MTTTTTTTMRRRTEAGREGQEGWDTSVEKRR